MATTNSLNNSSAPFTVTSGNLTITSGNLTLPATTSTVGQIVQAGARFLHSGGSATNTFLGTTAGNFTVTGTGNTAVGNVSGGSLSGGSFNSIFGNSAGPAIDNGDNNVAIGKESLLQITSGSGNTCIGTGSGGGYTGSDSNNISIGGANGQAAESFTLRIGQATGSSNYGDLQASYIQGIYGASVDLGSGLPVLIDSTGLLGTAASSARFKENIYDMLSISDDLHKLRPVVFNYIKDKKKHLCYGLIAEEVEKFIPNLVVKDKEGQPFAVKYHDIVPMLLNEVQKLRRELNELKGL